MASTSSSRTSGVVGRIRNAAATKYDENQSLVAEIRKALILLKDIAVHYERENQSDKVKELDKAAVELLGTYQECTDFSTAIRSVGDTYEPGKELTDFGKLFDSEIAKAKANSSSNPENHPLLRQFREAIWNVHHHGQHMPGDEQEDIVMTSTQGNILNSKCPLTGKHVTELSAPVRSVLCKHVYEKGAILQHISSHSGKVRCPIAACPKMLVMDKVVCDELLLFEIDEMRSMSKRNASGDVVEDFTEHDFTRLDSDEDD